MSKGPPSRSVTGWCVQSQVWMQSELVLGLTVPELTLCACRLSLLCGVPKGLQGPPAPSCWDTPNSLGTVTQGFSKIHAAADLFRKLDGAFR